MRYALLVLALCTWTGVFAQDDVSIQAKAYLIAHSSEAAETAWREKQLDRIQRTLNDSAYLSSENAAADSILMTWFGDRKDRFEANSLAESDKVELCFIYNLYQHCGWTFPDKVAQMITEKNVEKWIGIHVVREAAGVQTACGR